MYVLHELTVCAAGGWSNCLARDLGDMGIIPGINSCATTNPYITYLMHVLQVSDLTGPVPATGLKSDMVTYGAEKEEKERDWNGAYVFRLSSRWVRTIAALLPLWSFKPENPDNDIQLLHNATECTTSSILICTRLNQPLCQYWNSFDFFELLSPAHDICVIMAWNCPRDIQVM